MTRLWPIAGGFLVWLVAGSAFASDYPKALRCTFTSGTTSSYEAGAFKAAPASDLVLDLLNIDLDQQSAEVSTTASGEPNRLGVARALGANHFLEVVTEGFWNITTIYEADAKTGKLPAVHSRHFGLVGQPVVSQYTGLCEPR